MTSSGSAFGKIEIHLEFHGRGYLRDVFKHRDDGSYELTKDVNLRKLKINEGVTLHKNGHELCVEHVELYGTLVA